MGGASRREYHTIDILSNGVRVKMITPAILSFAGGVVSPEVLARKDLEKASSFVEEALNVVFLPQGGVKKRDGTIQVGNLGNPQNVRMFSFHSSNGRDFLVVFHGPCSIYEVGPTWTRFSANVNVSMNPQTVTMFQSGDQAFCFSSGSVPQVLSFTGNGWTVEDFYFTSPPRGEVSPVVASAFPLDRSPDGWWQRSSGINLVSANNRPIPMYGRIYCDFTRQAVDVGGREHPKINGPTTVGPDVVGIVVTGEWECTASYSPDPPKVYPPMEQGAEPVSDWTQSPQNSYALVYQAPGAQEYSVYARLADGMTHKVLGDAGTVGSGVPLGQSGYMLSFSGVAGAGEHFRKFKGSVNLKAQPVVSRFSRHGSSWYLEEGLMPVQGQKIYTIYQGLEMTDILPACGTFFGDRLCFAGGPNTPNSFWMSQPGDYYNFMFSAPPLATDGIYGTLMAREGGSVRHMIPMDDLIVLTEQGMWRIEASGESGGISSQNIRAKSGMCEGASWLTPLQIKQKLIYNTARGNRILSAAFNFDAGAYVNKDLSILARHLLEGYESTGWGYQAEPSGIIWIGRNDGKVLSLTYQEEHNVIAWGVHDFGGSVVGVGVCEGKIRDSTFIAVRRPGGTVLERLTPGVYTDNGRNFTSRIVIPEIDIQTQTGSTLGNFKTVPHARILVKDTTRLEAGAKFGKDEYSALSKVKATWTNELQANNPQFGQVPQVVPYTGYADVQLRTKDKQYGRVVIESKGPNPMEILSLIYTVD